VFTCTIIIGLALDYDVFLFARVIELRKKGYSS
jgi:predicted RND superfamily exporter protein